MDADGYFDKHISATYDEYSSASFAPELVAQIVDRLVELADGGPVLEFGIGTGRIALPLAQRGLAVSGIDLSASMVDKMREKPGGTTIPVEIGDFASTKVDGQFSLVYLVANTIMNLTTQAAQVACFRNAASHLKPGGYFVIEVSVPDLQRLPPGETIRPFSFREDRVGFDEYRIAEQGLTSHHMRIVDGRWEQFSIPFRYVWPAELDLMAEISGLQLRDRWDGWAKEPFTDDSRRHVSVWQKPLH